MKMFTKLALVSSIAISANAMAMQAMDDAALSATTGQAGLTVTIDTPTGITIQKLYIHDNDGLATAQGGTGNAGAIRIGSDTEIGVSITKVNPTDTLATLVIDTDAGTNGDAFLNVAATLAATTIDIGSISIVPSNGNIAPATGVVRGEASNSNPAEILSGLTLTTGEVTANIQLGNSPQGALVKLNSAFEGGLSISNLGIVDNASEGQVNIGEIRIADTGGSDLTANADINITSSGLEITALDTAEGTSMYISDIKFVAANATQAQIDAAASIGDIEIVGLKTGNSTITISGH